MEFFLFFTAMWLGILTSISPCPLATNIAAVSFISYRTNHKKTVFLSGTLYTIGRSITYIVIGFLIVKALIDIPILSDFLQRYINKILGIILIIVGMILSELLQIKFPSLPVSGKLAKKLAESGVLGSLLLGIIFALAFCPVSAALFFGGLIPAAIKAKSSIAMPFIYGVGIGLPVLLFAVLVYMGIEFLSKIYHRVTQMEFYTKRTTGIIFILVGIYYVLSHIFEIL